MNRFLALLLILAPLLPAMAADGCAPNEVLITDEFGDPQCKLTTVALSCPGGDAYKYFDQVCLHWPLSTDLFYNISHSP
jgi:hypothetical protein